MLRIVPTPLGNLKDITERCLDALRSADFVFAEDTRRSKQLLTHFSISKPVLRYNEHDDRSVQEVLGKLRSGKTVALVSDGGTPGLSDPGRRLVQAARREGLKVESLPGAFAAGTAVAGSGLPGDSFVFLGFLPRSAGKQRKALEAAKALERTIVVYESPFRVAEFFHVVEEVFGPDAQAVVARELTKFHEEWIRGTVRQVKEELAKREKILGEIVVVLHPDTEPDPFAPAPQSERGHKSWEPPDAVPEIETE